MSDPVSDLEAADEALRAVEREIDEYGEERVERLAERYDAFVGLLSRYERSATGSGREAFQSYVEFQGDLAAFVEDLPDDLPTSGAFERAAETLDRRRLAERDFDRARDDLAPVSETAALVEERADARGRYRDARHAVIRRRRELDERIDDLESTLAFADADFEADTDALREPIEAYDRAVREAFADFRASTGARNVLSLVEATEAYPLVSLPAPPRELRSYVADHAVGTEPIPTLLEYADYSFSKLDHYVDDPGEFKARVGANRTYLERLSADPLTIAWPPPDARELRYRVRELVAVVGRFAPDGVVSRLHAVRDLTRRDDYERLRDAAVARAALSEEERAALRNGRIEADLEAAREERSRLSRALDEYPER